MARLELDNVSVSYGPVTVLPDLNLTIEDGECIALLGPSGCGKTTTLRSVAGFVRPSGGSVRIGGRDMTDCPPHKRNVGLVFQDYALFSHMTVSQNVAYGLVRRGVPKAEIARKVADALAMVRMSKFAERYPSAMSGGQRQRVALARAIVIEPDVLLLDEPLGALDRKLRDEMQFELKTLQERLGFTCIIVTHDQEEALSLASRVALMFDGAIAEIGAPTELYMRPQSMRAMDFLGASTMFQAQALGRDGPLTRFQIQGGQQITLPSEVASGATVTLGVRPENIRLTPEAGDDGIKVDVTQIVFKGASADVYVDYHGRALRAQLPATVVQQGSAIRPGASVMIDFDPRDVRVFTDNQP